MLYEYCYIYSISIQCKLCKQHLILIKLKKYEVINKKQVTR